MLNIILSLIKDKVFSSNSALTIPLVIVVFIIFLFNQDMIFEKFGLKTRSLLLQEITELQINNDNLSMQLSNVNNFIKKLTLKNEEAGKLVSDLNKANADVDKIVDEFLKELVTISTIIENCEERIVYKEDIVVVEIEGESKEVVIIKEVKDISREEVSKASITAINDAYAAMFGGV